MTRDALHQALDPIVAAWLIATCAWDDVEVGEHRFVCFSTEVSRGKILYVQFWSEPLEPVLWEVSSGKADPSAGKWLTGERSERIESLGFTIGGEAENFQREVRIDSPADAERIAREVVDIFYAAFDYRGMTPLQARLVYEGRSELRPTFEAFTPAEIAKVFAGCGYRVEEAELDHEDDPPLLRCRKRGAVTSVVFGEPFSEEELYGSVMLSCELEVRPEDVAHLGPAPDGAANEAPVVAVSTVLLFRGGVTLDWVVNRVTEWDAMLASRIPPRRRKRRSGKTSGATVH